jgi:hypothetical protein
MKSLIAQYYGASVATSFDLDFAHYLGFVRVRRLVLMALRPGSWLLAAASLVLISGGGCRGQNMMIQTQTVAVGSSANTVNMRGLLDEMVDYDNIACWPLQEFKVRQASSYDRARIAPDKPGWFSNNDGSNYVRTEIHDGREERVLIDVDGPGAIVRFFLTSSGSRDGRVRVYLDGNDTPAIVWPTIDLMDGAINVAPPLLERNPPPLDHGGATLYLPIPYAEHCKVTIEESDPATAGGRYYHIDYRTYSPGTVVETFDTASLQSDQSDIDRVNKLLSYPPVPVATKSEGIDRSLASGAIASVHLPPGPGAVKQLELTVASDLTPAAREQALRSVVIRGTFDDQAETIWCPVGDFEGSGAGGRPVASWYRTVDNKGQAVCRWVMPYHSSGTLSLENLGDRAVHVKLIASVAPWTWDDRSMYFHCSWHQQVNIPARPFRDWNFVTMAGRGVLVGDVMSVFNPIPSWYGEGNEKIWVDDDTFPSHLGTGTEDYYNASWAPNPIYQTPFSNHPRIDDPLSQGQNVYTRSRNLDVIPFDTSLKFDFEIETWKDSLVDYAATTYWYGSPGTKGGLPPEPVEARRPVPMLPPPMVIQGALECESLPVVAHSPGLVVEPQNMRYTEGLWSTNTHLLIRGKQVGDYVELSIPAPGNTPRRLTLYATKAYDYGILKFTVNGIPVEDAFDGYARSPEPFGPISLGVFTPEDGKLVLCAEIAGTNPASGGLHYLAALDAVVVSE